MNQPIKAGDICKVVGGMGRSKSPNLGLTVTVGHRVYGDHGGDHSQFGPIHTCTGNGVKQMSETGSYIETGWADFAIAWLEKVPPIKTDSTVTNEQDITA